MHDIVVKWDDHEESELLFRRKVAAFLEAIQEIPEPSYEERKWSENNLHRYITEVIENGKMINSGHKMFFVGDTGSVRQNEYVIEAVVWYIKNWFLPLNVLETLLAYENVVFRVEVKAEKEPQSCIFVDRIYDLIQVAVERRDSKLLRALVEYIKFDDYPYYDKDEIYQIIEENVDIMKAFLRKNK